MKLNKAATVELTASVWLVIAQSEITKIEALNLSGFSSNIFPGDDDFYWDCPCCDYICTQGGIPGGGADKQYRRGCKGICPLDDLWPKGCEWKTSPYKLWRLEADTLAQRINAMKIAEFASTLAGTWFAGLGGFDEFNSQKH